MVHYWTKKLWVPRIIFLHIWGWPDCPHKTATWGCVYLCAWVCKGSPLIFSLKCMCVYAHVYRCPWRPEEGTGSPRAGDIGSSMSPGMYICWEKNSESICVCLPSTGITDVHCCVQTGLGDPNSGPRTCMTNTNNWAVSVSDHLKKKKKSLL